MRVIAEHPLLARGMAAGEISDSWAREIVGWLKKLPEELRDGTEEILAEAAAAGASLEDLATIIAHALAQWEADHPDEDPEGGFPDRYLQIETTFGGAGVIRGDLTPECAAAVTAVLEALGKKAGPEDHRSEPQRFHDALQLACELLLRAKLVPDRAGRRHAGGGEHLAAGPAGDAGRVGPGGGVDPGAAGRERLPDRRRTPRRPRATR